MIKQSRNLLFVILVTLTPVIVTALTNESEPLDIPVEVKVLTPKEYLISKVGLEDAKLLSNIIQRESDWCHTKWNGEKSCPDVPRTSKLPGKSSAYGLCQTMMSYHGKTLAEDFATNPFVQVDWCISYAIERYGTINTAWNFWQENKHW